MADEIQNIDFNLKLNGTKTAAASLVGLVKNIGTAVANTNAEVRKTSLEYDKATAAVERQKIKVDELKKKLDGLSSGDVTPKSSALTSLNKEFEKTIATIERLEQKEDELKAKQAELASVFPKGSGMEKSMPEYQQVTAELQQTQKELESARNSSDKLAESLQQAHGAATQTEIQKTTAQLNVEETKLKQMSDTANATGEKLRTSMNPVKSSIQTVGEAFSNFGNRILGLAKRVFVFTMITKALRSIRSIIGATLMTDSAFVSSLNQLQAALWTAFSPILSTIVPALKILIGWLAKVISGIAQFIAILTGKSYNAMVKEGELLHDRTQAYEDSKKAATGAGKAGTKAAKDETKALKKELAAFDELQQLREDKDESADVGGSGGSGSAGGAGTSLKDAFKELEDFKLPEFFVDLAATIKDVFFKWGDNLTEEAIAKKIITAGFAVIGAVIGAATGGAQGALIGFTLGTALGLVVSSLLFDGDGKISDEEKKNLGDLIYAALVGAGLGALIGTALGGTAGGLMGALIGVTVGSVLTAVFKSFAFDKDGNLKPDVQKTLNKLKNWIAEAVAGVLVLKSIKLGAAIAAGAVTGGAVATFAITAALLGLLSLFKLDKKGHIKFDKKAAENLIKATIATALGIAVTAITGSVAAGFAISAIALALTLEPVINWAKKTKVGKNTKKVTDALFKQPPKSKRTSNEMITALEDKVMGTYGTDKQTKTPSNLKSTKEALGLNKGLNFDKTKETFSNVGESLLDWLFPTAKADALEVGDEIGGNIVQGVTDNLGSETSKTNVKGKSDELSAESKSGFEGVPQFFTDTFSNAYGNIGTAFIGLKQWGTDRVTDISDTFSNIKDSFSTWFSEAYTKVTEAFSNAKQDFEDVKKKIGEAIGNIKDNFKGWFDDAYKNSVDAFKNAKKDFESVKTKIKEAIGNIKDDFKGWFDDAYKAVTGAFDNVKTFFKGVKTDIVSVFTNIGSKIGEAVKDAFKTTINTALQDTETTLNKGVKLINAAIKTINKMPGVNLGTIDSITLPRLAQGMVVPPNREFAAILGDNTKEPEIVSPISAMEQAFMNALQNSGYTNTPQQIVVPLEVDGTEFGRAVIKLGDKARRITGKSLVQTNLAY